MLPLDASHVQVAVPEESLRPVNGLEYLPPRVERDVGTKAVLRVMPWSHTVVGNQKVTINIPYIIGQRSHIEASSKLLLLSPRYGIAHTRSYGDVERREEVRLHHIGIFPIVRHYLRGHVYLARVIQVLHRLITPVGGKAKRVGIGSEHAALVRLLGCEAQACFQRVVPRYLLLVVEVEIEGQRSQSRVGILASASPVVREMRLGEVQRGVARHLPEVGSSRDHHDIAIHCRCETTSLHLVRQAVIGLQFLCDILAESALLLDGSLGLRHQPGSLHIHACQCHIACISSAQLAVTRHLGRINARHHLRQHRREEGGSSEHVRIISIGHQLRHNGVERIPLPTQAVKPLQVQLCDDHKGVGLHLHHRVLRVNLPRRKVCQRHGNEQKRKQNLHP